MQTGTQGGDTTSVVEEPALVTALVAPLVKLRTALGTGARPDDTALAALTAVTDTVRTSDDTHRSGVAQLAGTETAKQAVPVIGKTNTEVTALADTSESLAPLLSSAYDVRDKAATDLDTLISDFRSQATPLVKSARSQADLDSVVTLARDYVTDGVNVVKAADGNMDTLTGKVTAISADSPGVTVPGSATPVSDTGGGTQVGTNYPNPANTQTTPVTTTGYPNNSQYGTNYYNGNSNSGGGDSSTDSVAQQLAKTNPDLAAQLSIQSAALTAATTLGSALISGAVTLGSALITSGAAVITTGIEKGETYAEKALAANTTQQTGGATPATTTPGTSTPGTTTPPTGGSLTPGLADPGPTTPATDTGDGTAKPSGTVPQTTVPQTTQPGATAPQATQPQAGVAPDDGSTVIPPVTGKPQPDSTDKKPRTGQSGLTPTTTT